MYRLALTDTRRIVVQEQQLELARTAVGDSGRVSLIPSFAESAETRRPLQRDAFLWVGRLVEYKLPLRYVDLPGASRGGAS